MKNEKIQLVEIEKSSFAVELLKDNVHVNLTQMAKGFDKTPKDWLRTEESKRYIHAVAVRQMCLTDDLLEVRQGGTPDGQGTWAKDRRIAMRFAQWLSEDFSIMVDEHLLKLMNGNVNTLDSEQKWCGLHTFLENGVRYVNYLHVLKQLGYSTISGTVAQRKRMNPKAFVVLFNQNFITIEYADLLSKQANVRQMTLEFQNKHSLKE